MKKQKVLIPILLIFVFFVVFLGCSILWKAGWWHSNAEEGSGNSTTSITDVTKINNKTKETLIAVNTTFYNYKYDGEIYNNKRNQGAQSCYDGGVIPFGSFDKQLSKYYKKNKVKVGIYTGNFYNYYGGLPGVGANKKEFPGYYNFKWAANIANRNSPYDSVCQGIVSDSLSEDDELMTETEDGNPVPVPYFNKSFLTGNDYKVNNVAIGAVEENVQFPFRKISSGSKKGYYEFDSTKDVVRFEDTSKDNYFGTGKLNYYNDSSHRVWSKASTSSAQFFPFNYSGDGQDKLDYGFGVRFDIPFYLSADGKLNGKNMVFEFSGDDDVWVFLDGKLVMDLGGQHGKAKGTIDFGGTENAAKVTVAKVTRVKGKAANETAATDNILAENTYIEKNKTTTINGVEKGNHTEQKHVLTVFYMERGMFESNFHMAFNFVPEAAPTPEPTAIVEPVTDPIEGGSLTIQNKVVFPTTTPNAGSSDVTERINPAFIEQVKDLAEDDVFQYSLRNQGTKATQVGDSESYYPSGVLTVRENGSDTIGKKKSYLSLGVSPVVRIYVDLDALGERYKEYCKAYYGITANDFSFSSICNSDGNLKGSNTSSNGNYQLESVAITNAKNSTKTLYYDKDNDIFYFDMLATKEKFEITISVRFNKTDGQQKITFMSGAVKSDTGTWSNYDGKVYKVTAITTSQNNQFPAKTVTWVDKSLPKGGGAEAEVYSSGLPYDKKGEAVAFKPVDSSVFNAVAGTSYDLFESHLAGVNTKILINKDTTSGITDDNGTFGLFYDDSATFKQQFAIGSNMQVAQKDSLMIPERYSGTEDSITETTSKSEVLTTFSIATDEEGNSTARRTSDYYYTEVKTENVTENKEVDVIYDGEVYQYSFSNSSDETGEVKMKQTFTNTIKYGSLIISKELKGHMDADENHSYGFKVTFSNVFGVNSGEVEYEGSYILVGTDGTQTTKKIEEDGNIILKPNEQAIITGIPVGTTYRIEELGAYDTGSFKDDGSVVSKIQTTYEAQIEEDTITSPTYTASEAGSNLTIDTTSKTISGIIPCSIVNKAYGTTTNEFEEVNVTVAFTNQFGAFTIKKQIAGDVNNAEYYNTNNTADYEKTYTFTVTDKSGSAYKGNYVVHTYENVGANLPLKDIRKIKETTDGKIKLKEGQAAEIGGISLTDGLYYTIEENISTDDIYFVESVKVTSDNNDWKIQTTSDDTLDNTIINGKKEKNTTYNTTITTDTFCASFPTFDVVYTNRYSNAYIKIDKLIDKLYCGDKKYAEYADKDKKDISYQDLTHAKQSFIFKIKQYKTEEDAKKDENSEGSFDVVVNFGDDTAQLAVAEQVTLDGVTYTYKDSELVKVLANRYYRIEEDTTWSWKYNFKSAKKYECILDDDDNKQVDNTTVESITENVVILRTYLDGLNEIKDGKVVSTAEFYNAFDSKKEDIEGDTDSIPNKIRK